MVDAIALYSMKPLMQMKMPSLKLEWQKNCDKRADQHHTYFSEGVYLVAFLANSHQSYHHDTKKIDEEIEAFLFQYIILHKGDRIFSTTRV